MLRCISKYQRRYVALVGGKLFYAAEEGPVDPVTGPPNCKGSIDFTKNSCEIFAAGETAFCIQPVNRTWISGTFTGVDSGRIFTFDTVGSEKRAKDWIEACNAHIQFASGGKDKAKASTGKRKSMLASAIRQEAAARASVTAQGKKPAVPNGA